MSSKARIEITAEDRGATQKVHSLRGAFSDLKAGAKDSILTGVGLGAGISAFNMAQKAVGAVFDTFKQGVESLLRIERIGFQTEARLRSTGGAANVTADGVAALAGSIEKLTGLEAESVQEGQNLLLTFTKIRNEAGAGNDVFDQATKTMSDMSVALGMDMSGAAMMLGKALNDPIRGITSLQRAGVQLTAQQRDQIKAFVEAGDVLSAQKVILGELATQVGGAAEAFGNTTSGKIAKFGHAWGEMVESIILGAVNVATAVDRAAGILAMHFGDMGDRANGLADSMGISFNDLKLRVIKHMNEAGGSVSDALAHIENEFVNAKVTTAAESGQMMMGVGDAVARGLATEVEPHFQRMAKMPGAIMRAEYQDIRAAAYQSQVEYAKGLLDAQNEPQVAMDALVQYQKETLSNSAQVNRLLGQLNSAELAAGLADSRPLVNAQARAARDAIVNQLKNLGAWSWGHEVGTSFADGMNAAYGYVRDAAGNLAAATRNQIGINSEPRDPSSPLRGITKWGGNIAKTMAGGIDSELGAARGAASRLAASLVPGAAGRGMAMPPAGAGGPVVIQLQLDGRTVAEVVDRHLYYQTASGPTRLNRG